MGIGFSFFKAPKHRVFKYQPLYFDERKEAMKERLERLNLEERESEEKYRPGKFIRFNMRKSFYESRSKKGSPVVTRFIILAAISGLLIMFYYLAKYFGLFFTQ